MEELFNLTYKDEVESIKDEANFEQLGDEKYLYHEDMEARLYWAFCRPSGSRNEQISDPDPLVSIMAFNHSRLGALERFSLLHPEVVENEVLRVKIKNRSRMLFRDLMDNDFKELNEVLALVPVFLDMAVHQLIHGRKWNDIPANVLEATSFLNCASEYISDDFLEAFYAKLQALEACDAKELKEFLEYLIHNKPHIHVLILNHFKEQTMHWIEESNLHILQKKSLEKLAQSL
jgi:hypothetical protein